VPFSGAALQEGGWSIVPSLATGSQSFPASSHRRMLSCSPASVTFSMAQHLLHTMQRPPGLDKPGPRVVAQIVTMCDRLHVSGGSGTASRIGKILSAKIIEPAGQNHRHRGASHFRVPRNRVRTGPLVLLLSAQPSRFAGT
jgi:hypothetical protein